MANIAKLIETQAPTISFEFSSPRDEEGEKRLNRTLERLAKLKPSFMSVTYGPSGTTRGPTEEVVKYIQHEVGITAMPHLTCVAHTRDEIAAILDRYQASGIENLLALHGDLPENDEEQPTQDFKLARELVAFARERTNFAIGVAAHLEGHPMSESRESDLEHQAAKLAEADFGVTQFFFRAEYYERFVEEMARRGVHTPIIGGIMPPQNPELVGRMAAMNNTEFPEEHRKYLEAHPDDAAARRAYGVEVATKLSQELIDKGAPGLHMYTLNFSQATTEIVQNLDLRRAPEPAG